MFGKSVKTLVVRVFVKKCLGKVFGKSGQGACSQSVWEKCFQGCGAEDVNIGIRNIDNFFCLLQGGGEQKNRRFFNQCYR